MQKQLMVIANQSAMNVEPIQELRRVIQSVTMIFVMKTKLKHQLVHALAVLLDKVLMILEELVLEI